MKNIPKLAWNKLQLLKAEIIREDLDNKFGLSTKQIKGFNFNIHFRVGFNPDNKLVRTEFEISLVAETSEPEVKATSNYLLALIYRIDNLGDLITVENEQILESEELSLFLNENTITTARGILIVRLQGTVFQNFILPFLDPADFKNTRDIRKVNG